MKPRRRRATGSSRRKPARPKPPPGKSLALPEEKPPLEAEDLAPAELGARKARAAVELVSQPTLAAAAKAAGVGERTLRRWLREDVGFRSWYRLVRREALNSMTSRLLTASRTAVDTLIELLTKKDRPEIRCRTALGIIAAATKAEEVATLAARVDADNAETYAARMEEAADRLSFLDKKLAAQLSHLLAIFGVRSTPEEVIRALAADHGLVDGVARPWEDVTAGDGP